MPTKRPPTRPVSAEASDDQTVPIVIEPPIGLVHTIERVYNQFIVKYTADMVVMIFDMVQNDRKDVTAELTCRYEGPGYGPLLTRKRFNLLSVTVQRQWANQLGERCPVVDDWQGLLEHACGIVVDEFRRGEPPKLLRDAVQPDGDTWLMAGLILGNNPTIWFGDGASGKSLIALAAAIDIQEGTSTLLRRKITKQLNVLYLDFEFDEWSHYIRMRAFCHGKEREDLPRIVYLRCEVSLAESLPTIMATIIEHNIGFIVLDSIAPACGGRPEDSDAAMAFFSAIRVLKLPVLCIAHETKKSDHEKPFGCHSADTEILTRTGWKRHDEWSTGEEILAFDKVHNVYTWQVPEKLWVYDYQGDMVRITMPSASALVTPTHRLCVRPDWPGHPDDQGWRDITAGDLNEANWKIPHANPLAEVHEDTGWTHADRNYPSIPFAQFLGYWISEGTISNDHVDLVVTQNAGPVAEAMKQTLVDLGFDFNVNSTLDQRYSTTCEQIRLRKARGLIDWLLNTCNRLQPDRHLPEIVWSWSLNQKLALLEALIDGDGTRDAHGGYRYFTSSQRLADDVQRLAIECGMMGAVKLQSPGPKDLHVRRVVNITKERHTLSLRRRRHMTTEPYDGKVYCFTVPADAYLTRLNGASFCSNNSGFWHNLARCTFWVAKVQDDGSAVLSIGMYNKKSNSGLKERPVGWTLQVESDEQGDMVDIQMQLAEVANTDGLAQFLSLRPRIGALLRGGAKTSHEIAEMLENNAKDVEQALLEMQRRGEAMRVENMIPVHWGLPEKFHPDQPGPRPAVPPEPLPFRQRIAEESPTLVQDERDIPPPPQDEDLF